MDSSRFSSPKISSERSRTGTGGRELVELSEKLVHCNQRRHFINSNTVEVPGTGQFGAQLGRHGRPDGALQGRRWRGPHYQRERRKGTSVEARASGWPISDASGDGEPFEGGKEPVPSVDRRRQLWIDGEGGVPQVLQWGALSARGGDSCGQCAVERPLGF